MDDDYTSIMLPVDFLKHLSYVKYKMIINKNDIKTWRLTKTMVTMTVNER
jgi:hypothetical protein